MHWKLADAHYIVAPKAHLHSSAKDGLGVPGFPYVRVTLILGFLKIFEFFLAEMEALHRFRKATVGWSLDLHKAIKPLKTDFCWRDRTPNPFWDILGDFDDFR